MKGINEEMLGVVFNLFNKSDLTSVSVECDENGAYKIKLSRENKVIKSDVSSMQNSMMAQQNHSGHPTSLLEESGEQANTTTVPICSPIVGTLYRASGPDIPPFVQVGDKVKKGDVLCIVEAMKVMNELEADFDMEIVAVLVENSSLVEFGQTLFEVKPL